jgi:hypothetical protein
MSWMNSMDIDMLANRNLDHRPIAKRAARFLYNLKEQTNDRSDGWAHWPLPSTAAKRLTDLLTPFKYPYGSDRDITEAEYKLALRPIKSFYTRRGYAAGMEWPSDE